MSEEKKTLDRELKQSLVAYVQKTKRVKELELQVENLTSLKNVKEAKSPNIEKNMIAKKCKHFEQFSWCNKGENCPLLHPKQICLSFKKKGSCPDSSDCKDLHQTADCEYWLRGNCIFEEGICRNGKHDKDKLGSKSSPKRTDQPSKKRRRVSSSGSMSESEFDDLVNRRVAEKVNERMGHLPQQGQSNMQQMQMYPQQPQMYPQQLLPQMFLQQPQMYLQQAPQQSLVYQHQVLQQQYSPPQMFQQPPPKQPNLINQRTVGKQ